MKNTNIKNPSWNEYKDIKDTLIKLLNKGYTKPMIETVLEQTKRGEEE